ncbi:multiple organellar RNA editing factor 7, mitochondrial [Sesamum indicum]|uniref:Multiple organellar RNA editing factor 7, mitochondrial n=1 Tax=Sesamum indicum TaxID=4182 RepID=A0A6I9STE0_SESIN|nr:multiple organellar RNA editing factor 7, mitochondrial [Sesamum indicum]
MMRKVLLSTASFSLPICRHRFRFFSDETVSWSSPPGTRISVLPRVHSLVDGCDYKHWLVVMHPPENYPLREEIIQQYIATLATALGSEKAAKESIYSVSTKYYYAFSCKLTENLTHRIRSLPRVKWVLPDSYLCPQETGYGGEPYIAGNVFPYEEKYHAEWLQSDCGEDHMGRTCSRKPRRKRRRSRNSHETSD